MKKYLITGFSGFVSKYFLDHLETQGNAVAVLGMDIHLPDFSVTAYKHLAVTFQNVNLLERSIVSNIISEYRPDYIVHLASYSSVAYSWQFPVDSFVNNTNIFLNLVEQVRVLKLPCRILSVGSSEEYGNVVPTQVPLHEQSILNPVSPYAVARVAQEMLTKVYVDSYGMDIILTRSFNHIGPGQKDIFVISSFAKQLAQLKKSGKAQGELQVGNINVIRDFVDVRDVVCAYDVLLRQGVKGEIYNVCGGTGITLKALIERMAEMLEITVTISVNPGFVRPNDNPVIIGSHAKLTQATGWTPQFDLDVTLRDILDYWLQKI